MVTSSARWRHAASYSVTRQGERLEKTMKTSKWTTNITKWTGLECHQAVWQAQYHQEWRNNMHPTLTKRMEHDDDDDDEEDIEKFHLYVP